MKTIEELIKTIEGKTLETVKATAAVIEDVDTVKMSRVYMDSRGAKKPFYAVFPKTIKCLVCGERTTRETYEEARFIGYNGQTYAPSCINGHRIVTYFLGDGVEDKIKAYLADDTSGVYMENFNHTKKRVSTELVVTPNDQGGVSFLNFETSVIYAADKLQAKTMLRYSLDYIPGQATSGVKHLSRGIRTREADVFEALGINSQNSRYGVHLTYEGADNLKDFLAKNPVIARNMGFMQIMVNLDKRRHCEPINLFIMIAILFSSFPQMEQLVKMGHYRLFNEALGYIQDSSNKKVLVEKLKNLEKLFNPEATKGKEALRMPFYVGQYLNAKAANISEYLAWCDIFELTDLSKEQFEKLVNSYEFGAVQMQCGVLDLPELLKYKYPLDKLCRYLLKQDDMRPETALNLLKDYRNMCSIADVAPDEYPSELRKRHDDMAKFMKAQQDAEKDKLLESFGSKVEAVVNKPEAAGAKANGEVKAPEYVIVVPKSMKDFQDEANMQNNCVGYYYNRVLDGTSIVFFVRKADTPDESFITAEYFRRDNRISQFFYKNNRPVKDAALVALGNAIGKKIKKGIEMGKI